MFNSCYYTGPHSVSELVSAYKEKQANQKASIIHSKKRLSGFQAANKKSAVVPVSSQISMYSVRISNIRPHLKQVVCYYYLFSFVVELLQVPQIRACI